MCVNGNLPIFIKLMSSLVVKATERTHPRLRSIASKVRLQLYSIAIYFFLSSLKLLSVTDP